MPRVICNLENASNEISGVKFHPLDDGGLVSDEISDELAELFLGIPGYEPFDGEPPKQEVKAPAPTSRKAATAKTAKQTPPPADVPPATSAPADTGAGEQPKSDEGAGEVF